MFQVLTPQRRVIVTERAVPGAAQTSVESLRDLVHRQTVVHSVGLGWGLRFWGLRGPRVAGSVMGEHRLQ